jgi:glycine cleavage system H protein
MAYDASHRRGKPDVELVKLSGNRQRTLAKLSFAVRPFFVLFLSKCQARYKENQMSLKILPDLRYTEDDEWIRVEGDEATIGVTDYAQDSLSDIVYLELPSEGDTFAQGDTFGVVESVKAASDLMMPVGGEITAVNEDLIDTPESVNEDPYGSWLIKISLGDAGELDALMDAEAYAAYCEERE